MLTSYPDYCLATIVAAEVLHKTVIVSATVALQEQLFHKDLPRLAGITRTCATTPPGARCRLVMPPCSMI